MIFLRSRILFDRHERVSQVMMSILDPPCAVAHGGKYAHFHPRLKHGNSKYRNSKSDILQKSINRGVAQLIARRIWDAEAASLSLATPTTFPADLIYNVKSAGLFRLDLW